ncbi:MAG: hypothetical protein ACK52M_03110, partial [bacterium]
MTAATASPQSPWLRAALRCAVIVPLVAAPLLADAPHALLILGSALAFWRAFVIGRRSIGARQHDAVLPVSLHSNWMLLASLAVVLAPHAWRLPPWLTLLVALFVGWRIAVMRRRLQPPPRALLVAMVSAASAGIF